MQKIAFKMVLKPGCAGEYRARHAALWPDLRDALRRAGIRDYSIHLDPETDILFATLWRSDDHGMDALPQLEIMQRWWRHMADIMLTHADNRPVATDLIPMFHLD